jgi:two-component system chemotaxis sensor kinase CheA
VGEVILNSNQLRTAAASGSQAGISSGLDRMDRVVGDLQRRALELRTTPFLRIVEPLPRMAREMALRLGKRVEVGIRQTDVELDRSILDRLSDPLVHMIRNAIDHGIEMPDVRTACGKGEVGHIWISAHRDKDTVCIEVEDDGGGIDLEAVRRRAVEAGLLIEDLAEDLPPEEIANFIFHPGLSTAEEVSELSGRGVGMDAVRTTIESLGGSVELLTAKGTGTTTRLLVPIAAAVQRVLLLDVAGQTLAFPVARIEKVLEVPHDLIESSGNETFADIDDAPVPVLCLARHMQLEPDRRISASGSPLAKERRQVAEPKVVTLVLTNVREERVAIRVERVVGQQQIYVKPVPELLTRVRGLAGHTILGDGRPVFVLDLNQMV